MTQKYSQEELNEAYLIQLVYTFQAAAMQQMGKLMNPLTGKVEKNMEQAKHSIDMLAMLESKTKGNLSDKEKRLLEQVLFELRMNYVDEMQVVQEEEEKQKGEKKVPKEEKQQPARDNKPPASAAGETVGEEVAETGAERTESTPQRAQSQKKKAKKKNK